jgi:hypothetical protein
MRTILASLALLLTAMLAIGGITSTVSAVGAPSENFTVPEDPLSDNATQEIKPANFKLQEASAVSQTTQPAFNFEFFSQSSGDKYTVAGNGTWEIYVDINLPGWIYIYEYLPPSSNPTGRWLAYKWQVTQSGIWKLGPFTPAANEPAGLHIYRVWYYADGKWAAGNLNVLYKDLAWNYIKAAPVQVVPVTPTPSTPVKENTGDTLYKFFTNPIVLLASPSLLVVIVILIRYLINRPRQEKPVAELIPAKDNKPSPKPVAKEAKPEQPVNRTEAALSPAPPMARARLVLPDGPEIQLNEKSRVIGRAELARALDLDTLGLISRKHFEITYAEDNFFIEDKASPNGTSLNGKAIAGQGPVKLNDADLIEPAGAIKLKFIIL